MYTAALYMAATMSIFKRSVAIVFFLEENFGIIFETIRGFACMRVCVSAYVKYAYM